MMILKQKVWMYQTDIDLKHLSLETMQAGTSFDDNLSWGDFVSEITKGRMGAAQGKYLHLFTTED